MNKDCYVDQSDLDLLMANFGLVGDERLGICPGGDLNGDCKIDLQDRAILMHSFDRQVCVCPPPPPEGCDDPDDPDDPGDPGDPDDPNDPNHPSRRTDIAVLGAATSDFRSFRINYSISTRVASSLTFRAYQSADTTFDASSDAPLAGETIVVAESQRSPNADGSARAHNIHLDLNEAVLLDASKPFVLIVADPSNAVRERSEVNNTYAIPFSTCSVGALTTLHQSTPYSLADLSPELQAAVQQFETLIRAEPGTPSFVPTSGHRPAEYQAHFQELRDKFIALRAIPGISAFTLDVGSGRPQLRFDANPPAAALPCVGVMQQVNEEILGHQLVPNRLGNPAVRNAGASSHESLPANAVDIAITGVSFARIDELARSENVNLYRPYGASDAVHFQLRAAKPRIEAKIRGESPINLLLIDAEGRRLGFDPASGNVVNDFGPEATYSGPGTEPQELAVPFGSVVEGTYIVQGIGTGVGPYSVILETYGEDVLLFDQVVATGVAAPSEPLGEIHLNIVTLSTTMPGDTNADGRIDLLDLNNVRNNFGGSGLGDANGDGRVDLADLNSVRNHFGQSIDDAPPAALVGPSQLRAVDEAHRTHAEWLLFKLPSTVEPFPNGSKPRSRASYVGR